MSIPSSAPAAPAKTVRDVRGRVYVPAIGPRLRILLWLIFASVGILGATAVYLVSVYLIDELSGQTHTNAFTLWVILVHLVVGVVMVAPFLAFGLIHFVSARTRKNRVAVRLGIMVLLAGIVVAISGLALIQLEGLPQLPSGLGRSIVIWLHGIAPVAAVVLYVMHRRAGPRIKWKVGIGWGAAVAIFTLAMGGMHFIHPQAWFRQGSPEGARYFEPASTRTVDGKFISAQALMMDSYCLKCHGDLYKGWFHSAHHFSSFNNPPYLFSVRETRDMSLKRDNEVRASRWCAGCHDPVVLLSGQFDNPKFDDVHDPTGQAGITCVVCHAMVNVNSTKGNGDYTIAEPEQYPFAFSTNPILQYVNNQLVKAKPDFHKKSMLKPFHKTAEFCSTCHKVSIPMALNHYKEFLRGQDHYTTYHQSGVSGHGARSFYYPPKAQTNCAGCHMPLSPSMDFGSKDFDGSGIRKIHGHDFMGGDTGLFALLERDPRNSAHVGELQRTVDAERRLLEGPDMLEPSQLACRRGSTTLTCRTGGFTAEMVGKTLQIQSGSSLLPGWYKIDAVVDSHTVTLDHTPAPWADGNGGRGKVDARPPVRIDVFGIKEGGTINGKLTAPLRPKQIVLEPGKNYLVEVVVRTVALGHPFTQGTVDSNEVWVDFQARAGDKQLGRNGGLDQHGDTGTVDERAHFINVLMLDRSGHRINRRNPQDIFTPLYNHQIPPGAASTLHYALAVPKDVKAPVQVTVRVRYRKFDFEYMSLVHGGKDKVPPLPIVDMCEDSIILPVKGVDRTVPRQFSPIEPAWQRWNDYGIGCFLEGGPDGKKGELRQAEEAFQQLLTGPKVARAHGYVNLARVYNAEGLLDKAVDVLNKAAAAQKDDPLAPWWTVAWLSGMVNAQNGNLDAAIADLEKVVNPRYQPHERNFDFTKDFTVLDRLGRTLFDRAQQETDESKREQFLRRAVERYDQALTVDSEDLDAQYGLAQAYTQLGEGAVPAGPIGEIAPNDAQGLQTLAEAVLSPKEARDRRLHAAFVLGQAVDAFSSKPTDFNDPRLPLLIELTTKLRPLYQQTDDPGLSTAAAFVLGHLHRQQHAIYTPDPNARDAAVKAYVKDHQAAGKAAQAIYVYPTNEP